MEIYKTRENVLNAISSNGLISKSSGVVYKLSVLLYSYVLAYCHGVLLSLASYLALVSEWWLK